MQQIYKRNILNIKKFYTNTNTFNTNSNNFLHKLQYIFLKKI